VEHRENKDWGLYRFLFFIKPHPKKKQVTASHDPFQQCTKRKKGKKEEKERKKGGRRW